MFIQVILEHMSMYVGMSLFINALSVVLFWYSHVISYYVNGQTGRVDQEKSVSSFLKSPNVERVA